MRIDPVVVVGRSDRSAVLRYVTLHEAAQLLEFFGTGELCHEGWGDRVLVLADEDVPSLRCLMLADLPFLLED
jgi:hypothetical protein